MFQSQTGIYFTGTPEFLISTEQASPGPGWKIVSADHWNFWSNQIAVRCSGTMLFCPGYFQLGKTLLFSGAVFFISDPGAGCGESADLGPGAGVRITAPSGGYFFSDPEVCVSRN